MAKSKVTSFDPAGLQMGPKRLNLWMMPGVSRLNVFTLLFGSFFGIAMMSFINASQPYVFTEILNIPAQEQGQLAGDMTFYQEIVIILTIGLIGAMSDKFGRKPIYVAAFMFIALGYVLYPTAQNVDQLILYRLVFALGFACNIAMLPSVANDYPQEPSRAKMIAVCFTLNGLGFIVILTPLRFLLSFFEGITDDAAIAGQYWLWSAAAIALVVSTVLLAGLKPGAPEQLEKRESFLATVRIGIGAGRRPRIALAYIAAIVSRGDLAVLSTFFTLWLTQAGAKVGMTTGEANAQAIKFYILIQVFALCWLPVMGWLLDRIDRVAGLALAMLLAGGGYFSLSVLPDPLGTGMYFVAALVGMGEMSANLSSLTLIGSEAPVKGRGAVIGLFSLFGAIGILLVAKVGGHLFGSNPVGPFVLVASANVVVLVLALAMLVWTRKNKAASAAA
jgi:MFS family permease